MYVGTRHAEYLTDEEIIGGPCMDMDAWMETEVASKFKSAGRLRYTCPRGDDQDGTYERLP